MCDGISYLFSLLEHGFLTLNIAIRYPILTFFSGIITDHIPRILWVKLHTRDWPASPDLLLSEIQRDELSPVVPPHQEQDGFTHALGHCDRLCANVLGFELGLGIL